MTFIHATPALPRLIFSLSHCLSCLTAKTATCHAHYTPPCMPQWDPGSSHGVAVFIPRHSPLPWLPHGMTHHYTLRRPARDHGPHTADATSTRHTRPTARAHYTRRFATVLSRGRCSALLANTSPAFPIYTLCRTLPWAFCIPVHVSVRRA